MKSEKDHILLQRYLSGGLDAEERWALEERLREDQGLGRLLEEYRLMAEGLRQLPEPEVPAGLWNERIRPALEQRLEKKKSLWERIMGSTGSIANMFLRPAVVVAFFAAVIIGVTLYLQSLVTEEPSEEKKAEETAMEFEQTLLKLRSDLEERSSQMEDFKSEMPEETTKIYEATMAKLDAIIEEAEGIYFANRYDDKAIEWLADAYKQKMRVIDQFMKMEL